MHSGMTQPSSKPIIEQDMDSGRNMKPDMDNNTLDDEDTLAHGTARVYTNLETTLMGKIKILETSNADLTSRIAFLAKMASQATNTHGRDIHSQVVKLKRERDECIDDNGRLRVDADRLSRDNDRLLLRIIELEREKGYIERERNMFECRNYGLSASRDDLQNGLEAVLDRLTLITSDVKKVL